ncbi:hypothetical protein [[Clostridium] innocuum]|nr:hypothetical protein [[Clostridium] innocuum]UOX50007.1 hypothetical protein K5I27_19295 [[Clostridium] innocuum]
MIKYRGQSIRSCSAVKCFLTSVMKRKEDSMMQKEEFENYKHMIVSEQPIFHAYIDMRSNVQYHINVYVSPWYKAYNYIFWIQNTTKDKSRAFRTEHVTLATFLANYVSNDKNTHEHLIREYLSEWIKTGVLNAEETIF